MKKKKHKILREIGGKNGAENTLGFENSRLNLKGSKETELRADSIVLTGGKKCRNHVSYPF